MVSRTVPARRGFAGADQVAVELVELHRVLAERLVDRGAALDVALDAVDHLLHGRVLLPPAMISSAITIGTPDFIMVASWRLKIAMSRALIFWRHRRTAAWPWASPGGGNACLRSSARSRLAFFASCSPFITTPRLSRPQADEFHHGVQAARFGLGARLADGCSACGHVGSLSPGDAVDLDQAGDPLFHLVQRGTPQVADPAVQRGLRDLLDITTGQHDVLDFLGHRHHLVDADAVCSLPCSPRSPPPRRW